MQDIEIRSSYKQLKLRSSKTDFKIVDELHLSCAGVRADIAIINGNLRGIEIKSAKDSLNRLEKQIEGYSKVFDYVTVVTEEKHANKILEIVPDWVSVVQCNKKNGGRIVFEKLKAGALNTATDPAYVAKLLWREELIDVLDTYKIKYLKADRNWTLCNKLCDSLQKKLVSKIVRDKLKKREGWKDKLY